MESFLTNLLTAENGAGMILVIVLVKWVSTKFESLQKALDEIKDGKTWIGECEKTHIEVNHRLERIEKCLNGNLK